MFRFIKPLFIELFFFKIATGIIGIYFIGFFYGPVIAVAHATLLLFAFLLATDFWFLFKQKQFVSASRIIADRLSNGDINDVEIEITNKTNKLIHITIYDEFPHQFQRRDISFTTTIEAKDQKKLTYSLVPRQRGVFAFGNVNVFIKSPLGLVSKREILNCSQDIKVYPSFLQLKKFEFYAIHNHLQEFGIKKIQKIGHNLEFEQIKEYVEGDDFRTLNWQATARRASLMVNVYQDEKSQNIYNVIDKGRVMKMPFEQMTLLDYAINASLVMSNIAISKQDKAGIMTFDTNIGNFLPATRQSKQMERILDLLYNQTTEFGESDYGALYAQIRKNLNQRSLIILYTNFENQKSMERQLTYLRQIAKQHVLVCVFFENTEIAEITNKKVKNTEQLYQKVIAEKFIFEKRVIVKKLNQLGIYTVLTPPNELTVNVINKYLQLKDRRII